MYFIFVRHGESSWNPSLISSGFQDLPLTITGRDQSKQCGSILYSRYDSLHYLYTSPLLRTLETANIINSYFSLPVSIIEELEEFKYHLSETYDQLYHRVTTCIKQLLQNDKPFMIVSHSKVFEVLLFILNLRLNKITFANAKLFTLENGIWSCNDIN